MHRRDSRPWACCHNCPRREAVVWSEKACKSLPHWTTFQFAHVLLTAICKMTPNILLNPCFDGHCPLPLVLRIENIAFSHNKASTCNNSATQIYRLDSTVGKHKLGIHQLVSYFQRARIGPEEPIVEQEIEIISNITSGSLWAHLGHLAAKKIWLAWGNLEHKLCHLHYYRKRL
jgi:hypothetical protein